MKININPRRVTQILLLVVAVLVTLSVAGQCYRYFIGNDPSILKIVGKVDLDGEGDCLPTWYQICSLFFCFILLTIITLGKRAAQESWVKHWGFLALTFLYLSLDEAISLHEQLSKLGKQVKATSPLAKMLKSVLGFKTLSANAGVWEGFWTADSLLKV